jgi:hypothetical protein
MNYPSKGSEVSMHRKACKRSCVNHIASPSPDGLAPFGAMLRIGYSVLPSTRRCERSRTQRGTKNLRLAGAGWTAFGSHAHPDLGRRLPEAEIGLSVRLERLDGEQGARVTL